MKVNLKALIKQINHHKKQIAMHRDALRKIQEDLRDIEDPLTMGIEALECAVDHFSEQL